MTTRSSAGRLALAAALALWLGVEFARQTTGGGTATSRVSAPAASTPFTAKAVGRPGSRPRLAPAPVGVVPDYNRELADDIARAGDPAAVAVLAAITNSLPPGWEQAFVLHDCLLAVVALTDMARIESPAYTGTAEMNPTGPHPATTLPGDERTYHAFLAELMARWLARKYPALGEETIRSILREHTLALNPALGRYDLIPVEDSVRWLGLPEPRPEPTADLPIPDAAKHRYGVPPTRP